MKPLYPDIFEADRRMKPRWSAGGDRATGKVSFGARRGGYVRPEPATSQRVVTRITHGERRPGAAGAKAFASNLAAYVGYTRRDGQELADLFGRADTPPDPMRWKDDQRYFRLSLNPEHALDIADMKLFVREVMIEVEKQVIRPREREQGLQLEWVATVHQNVKGNRPHAHVLVRDRVGREDIVLDPTFATVGIRNIARNVATREHHLGPRSWQEIEHELERTLEKTLELERRQERARELGLERGAIRW